MLSVRGLAKHLIGLRQLPKARPNQSLLSKTYKVPPALRIGACSHSSGHSDAGFQLSKEAISDKPVTANLVQERTDGIYRFQISPDDTAEQVRGRKARCIKEPPRALETDIRELMTEITKAQNSERLLSEIWAVRLQNTPLISCC